MNKYSKYFLSALVAATTVGCNDLDTEPMGQYLTSDEKSEAIASNPDLAKAGVVAISTTFYQWAQIITNETVHTDYGWPSVMLAMDSRGADMVSSDLGYNWYSTNAQMADCTDNSYLTRFAWYTLYKQILSCNTVLAPMPEEITDPTTKYYAAQALAARAWAYTQLAQLYQHTYLTNPSAACVPLITEKNSDEAADAGCARNTVEEVYAQIMDDLNNAVNYLEASGMSGEDVIDTGAKRFISTGTAYGLRARVNLLMGKWAEAASDAQNAISKSGATPYTIAEAGQPTFTDLSDHSWMWGIYVGESDRVVTTGICNWPSHLGSLNYGYASVGGWRAIAKNLYASIPSTDVRKGWFIDGDGQSANLTAQQQRYILAQSPLPYTQVKFAPYQGVLGTSNNACDVPLMRVEEMYLILAEAKGMTSAADGAQVLNDFVKTYRNPSYNYTATTSEALRDEVWHQRRIELWGEGMSMYDVVRLRKGIDRRGGGWESQWVYNIEPGAQINVLPIPQAEINANPMISEGQNNQAVPTPTPVDDVN